MNLRMCFVLVVIVFVTGSSALLDNFFSKSPEKMQEELDKVTDSLASGTLTDFSTIKSYLYKVYTLSKKLGHETDRKLSKLALSCEVARDECDYFRHGFVNFIAESYVTNGRDIGKHLQPYLDHCAAKAYKTCSKFLEKQLKSGLDQLNDRQKADLETLDRVFINENNRDVAMLVKENKIWVDKKEDVINALPVIFESKNPDPINKEYEPITFEGATKEQIERVSHIFVLCDDIIVKAWDPSMNYFTLLKYSNISDLGSSQAKIWLPRIQLCWQIRVVFGGRTADQVYEAVHKRMQESEESTD